MGVRDVPNDQGGRVFLTWHSPLDKPGARVVTGYRVWRRAPNPGARAVPPDGATLDGHWEAMATLPAEQLINYAYEAATTQDSVPEGNPYTAFFVSALTSDPFVFFQSAPDSGYDNLSPPTPGPFAALYRPGSTALHWTRSPAPDFSEFRLYRGLSPEFVPGPINLVIASPDTTYVDVAAVPYVYKLTATDTHGNESRYAMVTPGSPVWGTAQRLELEGARPNPAVAGQLTVAFTLPNAEPARLELIDVSGRRLAARDVGSLGPGRHSEST